MADKNYFLNTFKVSEAQLGSLVARALRSGGQWCDLYFEYTAGDTLTLRDGAVCAGGSQIDYGCGIRVLEGEKTGYAYSESTDWASLCSAAEAAGAIASGVVKPRTGAASKGSTLDCYGQKQDWRSTQADAALPFLEKLEARIRQLEPRTFKVTAQLSSQVSEIMMYNSLGELSCDTRPLGAISVSVVFKQGDRTESCVTSRSYRCGAEMLSDSLLEELALAVTKGLDDKFAARRPKGGKMTVVMAAGASGILLHEAMGHAFEADFNRKGQSVFAGRMGQRICREGINIVDDATLPGNRGSLNYDDEGVPGQKTYMVRDGVLTSYLHDRISAAYFGVEPTGNGRRESFRYNPIPRMRATYMESGPDGTLDDLISSVDKGVFVSEFANGEVKIGEGDFTFYVRTGYLIEKGRPAAPVKDINIIGNGPRALADIEAVAGDLKVDEGAWTCGKEQSAPVSCGIPSVLVRNLTVGGV